MTVRSKFDEQLEMLLTQEDVNSVDDMYEEDDEPREMVIVKYDDVKSHVDVSDDSSAAERDRIEDYKQARTIYHGLLTRGISSLEQALVMARESEHPRAFEVVANMMKQIADINKDMLGMHKDTTSSRGGSPATVNNTQINNYPSSEHSNEQIEELLSELEDDIKEE